MNKNTTCLILASPPDSESRQIELCLRGLGVASVIFDTSKFPESHDISFNPDDMLWQLVIDGKAYSSDEFCSVYWRSVSYHSPEESIAARECKSVLQSFLKSIDSISLNTFNAFELHSTKPFQLATAKKIGAKIPKTYIGNNYSEVTKRINDPMKTICKPVLGGFYTKPISLDDIDLTALPPSLKQSPITIQEYIDGTNIRTYIVGEKTFSFEIQSTKIDFRVDSNAIYRPYSLHPKEENLALLLAKQFELRFAAIDWRLDSKGQLVFLEINPSPMFVNFSILTDCRIDEHLAKELAKKIAVKS